MRHGYSHGYSPYLGEETFGCDEAVVACNYFYVLWPCLVMKFGPLKFSAYAEHLPTIQKVADKMGWAVETSPAIQPPEFCPGLPDIRVTMTPIPAGAFKGVDMLSAAFIAEYR